MEIVSFHDQPVLQGQAGHEAEGRHPGGLRQQEAHRELGEDNWPELLEEGSTWPELKWPELLEEESTHGQSSSMEALVAR